MILLLVLEKLSVFDLVISGSATRRSSFALGKVVLITSFLNKEAAIFLNIADRCELLRFNCRPEFL